MDKPRYIRIAAIQSRMRAAERERVPIYVHAPTGTGKTAAVNFYYRNKRVCMLSGIKGFLDQMPPVGSIEEDTVVIDDMSFIVDTQSQDYVKGLIRSGEKHLVMLGRCVIPHYLLAENMAGLFLTCDETVMSLDEAAIGRLAAEMGVPTDARDHSNGRRDRATPRKSHNP